MSKKFLPVFLSQSFREVAVSLLSFFGAVYIYQQTLSFFAVFGFFLLLYIFKLIGVNLAENLSLKFGLKKQIAAGEILTMMTVLAFSFSQNKVFFLWLAALLWGLAIGFFWFGRHGLLAKMSNKEIFGRTSGSASAFNSLMLISVPFLGGFLIKEFGYQGLFYGALIFIILGILVLTAIGEEKTHKDVTIKEIYQLLTTHKKMALAYFGLGGIEVIYSPGLILYIFLLLGKEFSLGEFFSLSLGLAAVAQWLVGHWVDKRGKNQLIFFGSLATFLVWILRFLTKNIGALLILDVTDRIAGSALGIPLEVLSFEKALDGGSTGRALLFRETAITTGSIFTCLLLLLLIFLKLPLSFSFLLAAGFALFPILVANGN